MSPKEKKMALWLSLMIAFWLLYPFMGIGIAWGTMLLTSLMFLPRIGVLDAKAFADVPVGISCIPHLCVVDRICRRSHRYEPVDCRYGAPSFFTKRYSVNRHFYISNIIGHPYFDRISVGHRCRYFSHTDIVRRCSGIGRKPMRALF